MIFTKQFIKVTPKDGGHAVVVPASNEPFYLAQGAKIEEPTKDEIVKHFPELVKKRDNFIHVAKEELHAIIAQLEERNKSLEEEVARLKSHNCECVQEEQPKKRRTRTKKEE